MRAGSRRSNDHYIGFHYSIDRQSVANLMTFIERAMSAKAASITLCLSSNGGAIDQGWYVYEILRGLPVPLITHAIGSVQSAAMYIFMAGRRRYATDGATFMFHPMLFSPAAGQIMRRDDLTYQLDSCDLDLSRAVQTFSRESGLSVAKVRHWFAGERIRDTRFALTNGIIHEIRPLDIPTGAEFGQVPYKF